MVDSVFQDLKDLKENNLFLDGIINEKIYLRFTIKKKNWMIVIVKELKKEVD